MSKRYKGYSKVAGRESYPYSAKSAMYEHNQEKTQAIDKSIVTKTGLTMYSDRQVAERSSDVVVSTLVPERMTWAAFKRSNHDKQEQYLDSIFARYPSVMLSLLADMFGVNDKALSAYLKKYGDKYCSKNRPARDKDDQVRFKKEMLKGVLPLGDKPKAVVETPKPAPVEKSEPLVTGGILKANLRCDAKDLPRLIAQLGMVGTVNVFIASADAKQRKDGGIDGLE